MRLYNNIVIEAFIEFSSSSVDHVIISIISYAKAGKSNNQSERCIGLATLTL